MARLETKARPCFNMMEHVQDLEACVRLSVCLSVSLYFEQREHLKYMRSSREAAHCLLGLPGDQLNLEPSIHT